MTGQITGRQVLDITGGARLWSLYLPDQEGLDEWRRGSRSESCDPMEDVFPPVPRFPQENLGILVSGRDNAWDMALYPDLDVWVPKITGMWLFGTYEERVGPGFHLVASENGPILVPGYPRFLVDRSGLVLESGKVDRKNGDRDGNNLGKGDLP